MNAIQTRAAGAEPVASGKIPKCATPRLAVIVATLIWASFLLFARLGHYALWDDESLVALGAQGVLQTGDTTALIGHNIVAFRDGLVLRNFKDRSTPPLATYLTALSFAVFGEHPLAARLPFAIAGLGAVALMLYWANSVCGSMAALGVFCVALAGNVSFFLYSRQCRYYALVMLLTLAIAWLYLHWNGSEKKLLLLGLAIAALFAAHYLTCVCCGACLLVDYAIWRRHEKPLSWRSWSLLLGTAGLISAPLALVWNPFTTAFGRYAAANTLVDRATLWIWQWRDMNQTEMFSGSIVLVAFLLAIKYRDRELARGLMALLVFVTAITALSPQVRSLTSVADVRYLTPAIPLSLGLSTKAICRIAGGRSWLALGLAVLAFGGNLLNGGPWLWCGTRSTLTAFVQELGRPIAEPYTPTAAWLRTHVPEKESVWVVPDYCTYPLMFHAPKPLYAWQFSSPDREYANLNPIHFKGRVPPKYMVLFGPARSDLLPIMKQWRSEGFDYRLVDELPYFWKDLYRPELFWRSFVTIAPSGHSFDAVYIFRLQTPNK